MLHGWVNALKYIQALVGTFPEGSGYLIPSVGWGMKDLRCLTSYWHGGHCHTYTARSTRCCRPTGNFPQHFGCAARREWPPLARLIVAINYLTSAHISSVPREEKYSCPLFLAVVFILCL